MKGIATKASLLIGLSAWLIGCANEPTYVDNSPENPTVVLDAQYTINGYILPDAKGKQKVYTRADRRRIDQTIEYDSWISRRILGNANTGLIGRTDLNLAWHVDNTKKTFYECPLEGCDPSLWKRLSGSDEQQEEDTYEPEGSEQCPLTPVKRKLTVTKTGKTRTIHGFNTQQYKAVWDLVSEDSQKRKDTSQLIIDFWVTQPTQTMRDTWAINGQFQENYLARIGANANPLARFFSRNVYSALAAFSGDISKDRPWHNEVSRKLATVKGYPISIKMEWFLENNACADVQAPKTASTDTFDVKDPVGSVKNALGGFFKKKAKEQVKKRFGLKDGEPVFRYIYDVTNVELAAQKDSIFEKPLGYKFITRQ